MTSEVRSLESKDTFSSYRPSKTTWCNTGTFAFKINEGFQHKQQTVTVATSLKDTCNFLDFAHLSQCLLQFVINPLMVKWIAATLMERTVALGNKHITTTVKQGHGNHWETRTLQPLGNKNITTTGKQGHHNHWETRTSQPLLECCAYLKAVRCHQCCSTYIDKNWPEYSLLDQDEY